MSSLACLLYMQWVVDAVAETHVVTCMPSVHAVGSTTLEKCISSFGCLLYMQWVVDTMAETHVFTCMISVHAVGCTTLGRTHVFIVQHRSRIQQYRHAMHAANVFTVVQVSASGGAGQLLIPPEVVDKVLKHKVHGPTGMKGLAGIKNIVEKW